MSNKDKAAAAQAASLVIPVTSSDNRIAHLSVPFQEPIVFYRGADGNGRKHVLCVGIHLDLDARKFKSSKITELGKDATNVSATVFGYDVEVDDKGEPVREGEGYKLIIPEDKQPRELVSGKLEWGPDYLVPRQKRTAEDQLRVNPQTGWPMEANTYQDNRAGSKTFGKIVQGSDKVNLSKCTGVPGKMTYVLRHYLEFGNETLNLIVASVPLGSDSATKKAQGAQNQVAAAAAGAEKDPFAATA